MFKPFHPIVQSVLFQLFPLILLLQSTVVGQATRDAEPISKKSAAPTVSEVREMLQQLDTMTDSVRQTTAEQLSARLLAELDYRPEIERLRGQRAALQQLQTSLTESASSTSKQLEAHRSRLLAQVRDIEVQSKSDPAQMERRKSAALQSSAPAIRRLITNQTEYSKQLKDLALRLERCEATEQSLTDQLSISLDGGYVGTAPISLPKENVRPLSRRTLDSPSPSDKVPDSNKKLMQELGLDPK